MNDLQAAVAAAADSAGAHSSAPTLLVQLVSAVGRLAAVTDKATEAGRRPFRVPYEWNDQLSELAWLVYLLADQTGVDLDAAIRRIAGRIASDAAAERARQAANRGDDAWF